MFIPEDSFHALVLKVILDVKKICIQAGTDVNCGPLYSIPHSPVSIILYLAHLGVKSVCFLFSFPPLQSFSYISINNMSQISLCDLTLKSAHYVVMEKSVLMLTSK